MSDRRRAHSVVSTVSEPIELFAPERVAPLGDSEGLSIDATVTIDVWCSMSAKVRGSDILTEIVVGPARGEITLTFTDDSLMKFAVLVNDTVRALLRVRGIPVPKELDTTSS